MTALILATVTAFAATSAAAAPSISQLRAQVAQIQAEVAAIDDRVGEAAEAYNGAVYRLDQVTARIAQNRRVLAKATRDLTITRAALSARIRASYMRPPPSQLELVLGSRSLSSLRTSNDALKRVSAQDASLVRSISALRKRTLVARKALVADEREAKAEVTVRARQRDVVTALLRRRQAVLSSAEGELGRMLAAERARQRAAEAAAQRQALERLRRDNPSGAPAAPPSRPASPAPASPAPTVSGSGSAANARAAQIALQYLGVPYVWGGASPSGFDCSGLASYAYAKVGKSVPHYTGAIWAKFPRVSGPLQPGDLVFYRGLGHMGIYIGGGQMVHAPRTGDVVKITAMSSRSDYVGAVRP